MSMQTKYTQAEKEILYKIQGIDSKMCELRCKYLDYDVKRMALRALLNGKYTERLGNKARKAMKKGKKDE